MSTVTASPKVGMNGTRIRSKFDGRWVNTIVFSIPIRFASQPATIDEPAWTSPVAKNTRPSASVDVPNFFENQ